VFSFKLRGAFNKMAKLPREALERGVITSSAGNHAQGVALAAAKLVRLHWGPAAAGHEQLLGISAAPAAAREVAVHTLYRNV
jgi:hypothetical protein